MVQRMMLMLMRGALWFFIRRIEVEGAERVPARGPVLLAPNHVNALLDPFVIALALERRLTPTAKAALAAHPLLWAIFKVCGVIYFHRAQDKGSALRKNVASMREVRRRLEQGGMVCVFPEGQSHSDPHLREFQHGVARIAYDYMKENPQGEALAIVPVGLHFERKDRLRSRVWLRFGEPIDVAAWRRETPEADYRALTGVIERGVRAVTLNLERPEDLALLQSASEILITRGAMPPALGHAAGPWAERVALVSKLQRGYEELAARRGEAVEALARRVREYAAELRELGIAPPEVYLSMSRGRALVFVLREMALTLAGLPVAAWGLVNHLPALAAVRAAVRRLTKEPDQWASNALFAGLGAFPFFYCVQVAAVAWWTTAWWTLAYAVSLPVSGVVLVLYQERLGGIVRRGRTFVRFAREPELQERLAGEGRGIIAGIQELAAMVTGIVVQPGR